MNATIRGQLSLTDAALSNPGGDAVSLDNTDISGGFDGRGLNAEGTIRALNATIRIQLDLTGATTLRITDRRPLKEVEMVT